MPCFSPLTAYKAKSKNEATGKWPLVFNPGKSFSGIPFKIPCGQCIGCKLEYARQWAVRICFEASLYRDNSFVTLTYNSDNLPYDGSLNKTHIRNFMKRLRRKNENKIIRFYQAGEYGDGNQRPHHHVVLFNKDFEDKRYWRTSENGFKLYRSAELEKIWKYGNSEIGEVTFESAAYIAKYCTKKHSGNGKGNYYRTVDIETGEISEKLPEFATQSRRPGIGREWIEKYMSDVYPMDCVVIRGNLKCKPPRYFDKVIEDIDNLMYMDIKKRRQSEAININNTERRLKDREKVAKAKESKLKRTYERIIL